MPLLHESHEELHKRIIELENRLEETEDTLRALRLGEVDAIVMSGPDGETIYTLKGADEAYRQIVEEMTEGAVTLAPDGLILFSNERFAAMLGMPRDHVMGSRLDEFIAPEDRNILPVLRLAGLQHGKAEANLQLPGARLIPVYLSWKWIRQDGLECISVVVTDLSEQKRNAAIVAEEKLARSILEQASEAMIVTDLKGKIIRASRSANSLAGLPVFHRHFDEVFDIRLGPEDQSYRFDDILRELRSSSTAERVEARAVTRSHRTIRLLLTSAPLAGSDGELLGCIVTMIDVTQRRAAEEAVRRSEARLRFMAESMPQKIFTATPDGNVDYFNQLWMKFTGLSFDQIKGMGWTLFIHPDDVEENVRAWKHSVETGEPFECKHRFRRWDGVYRWHLSRAHAMRDTAGQISMWIGSDTDIHEEKETEAELRRLNENLNQFAYAASHDFQEPLRMITSYSQMLVKGYSGQLDGEAAMCVEVITEGTQRMRALLADLLSFTEAGADGDTELVDLNEIFRKVTETIQTTIAESEAVVTSDPLPSVMGQPVHFVQLFQNLIVNGIKYRSDAPPRIHVTAERRNSEWLVSITDNGMGIAPEYHQVIFGVFKRLHGKKIPGTGIGLAICQRVLERLGGRIWVESEQGQGSKFLFTLPVAEGQSI